MALSDSVTHWLGPWNTERLGLSNSHGTLPGSQESPTSAGGRILASNEGIIDYPIGSDPRGQYYATNVAELTIINRDPAEGAIIADVDSDHSVGSSVAPSVTSSMGVTSAPLISVPFPVESRVVRIDSSCVIHPFYIHKMDSGPVRLMTIAHAFNYRVAILRDGVWSAVRVGRSRKAVTCFLKEANISWGQQVTGMFQIVSTLMEGVPAFALRMRELQGESPDVQLKDDPWGHVEHCDANCACLKSDQMGAYIHNLLPMPETSHSTSPNDDEISGEVENGFMFNNDCGYLGVGHPGSIPFVSENSGAYGRLLLAVYVRWKTGLLISSDWLRPVTRGAWRAVLPDRVSNPDPVHSPVGTS